MYIHKDFQNTRKEAECCKVQQESLHLGDRAEGSDGGSASVVVIDGGVCPPPGISNGWNIEFGRKGKIHDSMEPCCLKEGPKGPFCPPRAVLQ